MTDNVVVRARVNQNLKKEAEKVLAAIGLTVSDVFRMLLTRITIDKSMPFDIFVPSEKMMEELHHLRKEKLFSGEEVGQLFENLCASKDFPPPLDNIPDVWNNKGMDSGWIDNILSAAEQIIVEQGVANMTIQAVAKKAGISKGGLYHYFPSKESIITELVERNANSWRRSYQEAYEKSPSGPGRMVRGFMTNCFADRNNWAKDAQIASAAFFCALINDQKFVEPIRTVFSELHDLIKKDGLPEGVGEAIVYAIDGLWLNWLLGFIDIDDEYMTTLHKVLKKLLQQALDEVEVCNRSS